MTSRKYYLDNLRSFMILLLFPYHIFMIYNDWGESFYIHGASLFITGIFNKFCWFFMMPLLFTIAGMSSRYALQRKDTKTYVKERVHKLLVPLVFGLLLIIPIQSYLGGIFNSGRADYFDYFTRLTDFSGYDGAFTPGQLWFILFLFVIAMGSLPGMLLYKNKGKGTLGEGISLALILSLGLLPCLGNLLFDIGGKSPTEYLAYFLLGYFFLANETVLVKLDKYRFRLLFLLVLGIGVTTYFNRLLYEAVSWFSVLAILGMGKHYLNFSGKVTAYLSKASFGIYLFHQSWIVIVGFFILKFIPYTGVQIPIILISSVVLTWLTYEAFRRVPVLRWMFGLKE